jgi:PKHD-type hydroxylase
MYITPNKLFSDLEEWKIGVDHIQTPYYFWKSLVSKEDCDKIIKLGEEHKPKQGTIGDAFTVDTSIRKSLVSWLPSQAAPWVYDFIWAAVQHQPWNYDVRGFGDALQYTVYKAKDQHFYNWHSDTGPDRHHRKVSFTLQLTDGDEYEGGEFELLLHDGSVMALPKLGKGSAFIFPSFMRHRVTKVTKGVRRSLVTWISGPKFR